MVVVVVVMVMIAGIVATDTIIIKITTRQISCICGIIIIIIRPHLFCFFV